jgi:hypothetical protein
LVIVGESLANFHSELEEQGKLVRRLKKKSLWSRNLEEVYNYEHMLFFLKRKNYDIWVPIEKINYQFASMFLKALYASIYK